MRPSSHAAPVGGNRATLLVDEARALPRLLDAIAGARKIVDISMFSWLPSGSGLQVAELLKAKARAGVEVDVLVDNVGSVQVPGTDRYRFFERLRAAGVHVLRNEHFDPRDKEAVDHQKLYVIDGKTAFVGGMNLSSMYDTWHDTMVQLDGPAAVLAAARFVQRWESHGGVASDLQRSLLHASVPAAGDASVGLVGNDPGTAEDLTALYLQRIAAATRRIWIESPVISSELFANALAAAARRGVDVRLAITGGHAEHAVPLLPLLSRSFYPQLLAAGVRVVEQGTMSHSKVLLTDDEVSIGSMNLTNRSAIHDFELNATVQDAGFTRQVEQLFATDLAAAHAVTAAELRTPLDRALARLRLLHIQY